MSNVRELLRVDELHARLERAGFVELLALREEIFIELLGRMLAGSEDSQRIWLRSARRPS